MSLPSPSPPSLQIEELESVSAKQQDGSEVEIRCFSLTCQNVKVEVCSVGASITKILLPRKKEAIDNNDVNDPPYDDIVLGYQSPASLLENPPYFAAIVGRVANRIAHGKFHLNDQEYQLAINNGPNHLHGGLQGFSHKNWNATTLPNGMGVQFSLISANGDEGYPGAIQVLATYSLQPGLAEGATTLRLDMEATLLSEDDSQKDPSLSTPINLAQHSYFNLAGHDYEYGILDHRLWMPNCHAYTPKDAVTSIPTRHVMSLDDDSSMDWRQPAATTTHNNDKNNNINNNNRATARLLRDGLVALAVQHEGLTEQETWAHVNHRLADPTFVAKSSKLVTEPYGFDHNYVVNNTTTTTTNSNELLTMVGILEHEPTQRRMTVRSNAPGVQVYTANYVGGLDRAICKDEAVYGQWQGICLETQHYPDSILSTAEEEKLFPEFAKGKCFILRPGGDKYQHTIEYEFGNIM